MPESAPPRAPAPVVRTASDAATPTPVHLIDTPMDRVRQPNDLVNLLLGIAGIALIMLLAVFAHATTVGVQEDVRGFSDVLAQVLLIPVALLEGLVTLLVPITVITELAIRRMGRQLVESVLGAGLGLVLAVILYLVLATWGSDALVNGLSVVRGSGPELSLPAYVASIAALLTVAGPRTRRRSVGWSWNLLWITIGIFLITAQVSLPGVGVTLLLGWVAGLVVRYVTGVHSERAYGARLIDGIRRAGFEPTSLVRVRDVADEPLHHDLAVEITPEGHEVDHGSDGWWRGRQESRFDPATLALLRSADHRVYAMTTAHGPRLDVVVLDGDRQVVGFLNRAWRSRRRRGSAGRAALPLRSVAERAALLMYAARGAGVCTPELRGVSAADDSMILIQSHTSGAVSLRDLPEDALTDAVLEECWRQLCLAHDAGLAHRALTADVVLLSGSETGPQVWLTGWESGDVASSELARRMDLAQMLALLALRVGAERALASAATVLTDDDMAAIGPLLQPVALPRSTREEVRRDKTVLTQLRDELVSRMPEASVEPERLTRFGARTILTLTLGIVAAVVVVTTMNFEEIVTAVRGANPWWALASFVLGALTWLGAAVAFLAFSPVQIGLWRVTLTQAAASYVALAAPAGIGPAALNLRLLTRRGVSVSLAGATVALVQISQVLVTVVLLVLLSVVTGDGGLLRALPSTTILWTLGGLTLAVAGVLSIPALRRWVLARLEPLARQAWPRLSSILSRPGRLGLGLLGNAGMTMGFVLAFDAALLAFGQEISLIDVAIIYLVGNAVGAAAPTPGGIGAIEVVLAGALASTAGVPPGIATSVVVLFRVMTYWIRIPIGWFAMRSLQRAGAL